MKHVLLIGEKDEVNSSRESQFQVESNRILKSGNLARYSPEFEMRIQSLRIGIAHFSSDSFHVQLYRKEKNTMRDNYRPFVRGT